METTAADLEEQQRNATTVEGEPLGFSDPAHDPEHDIDAKKTVLWLVFWTIAIFVCMWLLLQFFLYLVEGERTRKINEVVPEAVQRLRAQELTDLTTTGESPYGVRRLTLEQAMQRYVELQGKLPPLPAGQQGTGGQGGSGQGGNGQGGNGGGRTGK